MIAQQHMAMFGTTPRQLAHVAVKERANAQLNPESVFFGKPLSVEDVIESPIVMSPLHLFEVVMPGGGGAALVVTSADRARAMNHSPVYLLGAGERVTHRALSQAPSLTTSPLAPAISDAYLMAGIVSADIDFLSIYDCYSIVVAITAEDAGLCEKGMGGEWVEHHDFSITSDLPVNPNGGQLACGQADLAGGMSHIVEAVRQLRRTAGNRQIRQTDIALVTGNGATMSEEVALILGGADT